MDRSLTIRYFPPMNRWSCTELWWCYWRIQRSLADILLYGCLAIVFQLCESYRSIWRWWSTAAVEELRPSFSSSWRMKWQMRSRTRTSKSKWKDPYLDRIYVICWSVCFFLFFSSMFSHPLLDFSLSVSIWSSTYGSKLTVQCPFRSAGVFFLLFALF